MAQMVKNLPVMHETWLLIPELTRSPGNGNSNPFQYSFLEKSMDREAGRLQFMGLQRVGQD